MKKFEDSDSKLIDLKFDLFENIIPIMDKNKEIEEENNNIQEISANDLYKKFDEWNKDKQNEIDKIGNKDKKKVNKLKEMNIRLNRMPTPIEGVELIDIKLGAKLAEDDIFLEEDFVAQYMRRGQSLFYDKNSDTYYYARIGLNKFFDFLVLFLEGLHFLYFLYFL